jgi:pSer/pThr/pTyr-binding forkhead associated (FHA) protein
MGGLWHRISSAFERNDIGPADGRGEEDQVRPTATRYAPIRDAVERRVGSFLRKDLVSHLEIGANEVFLLHYIEIVADSQGEAELGQFLHEFSPESRVFWVKKLLGGAVGQHVSVDQFLGLDRNFAPEALAETDPFEEALNQSVVPPYRVILHGRWEAKKPGLAVVKEAPEAGPRQAGPRLQLSVQDAKEPDAGSWNGTRVIEVKDYPAVLGSSSTAEVEISGYYVSARHCTLHWEAQQLWLIDHSTNGTWVDGERVRHGARVALANGAVLGFGRDKGDTAHDRYPAIRARFLRRNPVPGADPTPVAPSIATPVAPAVSGKVDPKPSKQPGLNGAPLAVLAIEDASGSPRRDVLHVPFTIGRGSAQDYVVPDANQGVSREHLVIEAIDEAGARIHNRAVARNGTAAGTTVMPERFMWRFGEELVLGEKWASSPAVRLSLRPVREEA